MKDGIHKINGYTICVEDDKIKYCIFKTPQGEQIGHPYRWDRKQRCYVKQYGLTVAAFRAGNDRMTIIML